MVWHGKSSKRVTGARVRGVRKKRKYEIGSLPTHTKLGERKVVRKKTKGGGLKLRAISANHANVFVEGKTKKVKILDVVANPANPDFVRQKIITKGALIKTEVGLARVTSRPSQHGVINAVLVEK